MTATLKVMRAGPLVTIQDEGRFGMLRHGVSASGPMDAAAFAAAGRGGRGAIEITQAGIELRVDSGSCVVGFGGADFKVKTNGDKQVWPGSAKLNRGDTLAITPGKAGNFGYLRFDTDILIEPMMGSIATNTRARLGGLEGRALREGDVIALDKSGSAAAVPSASAPLSDNHIRVVWGLHAELFSPEIRAGMLQASFQISTKLDRMGVRLEDKGGVFTDATILSLVSDAIVPGDIQILGDGTPIVLMRDHQPTGGYPRIATIITADLDRFAQLRPGSSVAFTSVSVDHAQRILRSVQP